MDMLDSLWNPRVSRRPGHAFVTFRAGPLPHPVPQASIKHGCRHKTIHRGRGQHLLRYNLLDRMSQLLYRVVGMMHVRLDIDHSFSWETASSGLKSSSATALLSSGMLINSTHCPVALLLAAGGFPGGGGGCALAQLTWFEQSVICFIYHTYFLAMFHISSLVCFLIYGVKLRRQWHHGGISCLTALLC